MGCSNDPEKPLAKINKKAKKASKYSDNYLNHPKNNQNEEEKHNSYNNNSENNFDENDNEENINVEENLEIQNALIPNFQPYLQSKNDPYFNFPEVKENKFLGKGLKK